MDNLFIKNFLAEAHPAEAGRAYASIRDNSNQDNVPGDQSSSPKLWPFSSLSGFPGQKFDATKISIRRCKQMQRDPTIGFANYFMRAQALSSKFRVNCSNAQVAAFLDKATREILFNYISTQMQQLNFGYQGAILSFLELENLDWLYAAKDNEGNWVNKKVWSEKNINPIILGKLVQIPPECLEVLWDENGNFNGLKYNPIFTNNQQEPFTKEFDKYHSIMFTNEKHSVNGSVWGYPRIAHVQRPWWSKWFNWGIVDRHFEKDADPPTLVYYPANRPIQEGGQKISARERALSIGQHTRSGSTIALPSDIVSAEDGTGKAMREWEVTFLKSNDNFQVFSERFEQLDAMIMRGCMVPEESFKSTGGTSGYNSTGQLQEAFQLSQIITITEQDEGWNKIIYPHLLATNFPELNVTAKKETLSADSSFMELSRELIRGIANAEGGNSKLNIDTDALLQLLGLPTLDPEAIAEREKRHEQEIQQTAPPPIEPKPGQAGVTNEGFYVDPRPVITLSEQSHDADSVFLAGLTESGLFADPMIMSDALRLRNIWRNSLAYDFNLAVTTLQDYDVSLELDEGFFERLTRRLTSRTMDTVNQTRRSLMAIMRRGAGSEYEKAGLSSEYSWDPRNSKLASTYLSDRSNFLVNSINNTTHNQVRTFLANAVKEKMPRSHMPSMLKAHIKGFSDYRADMIVRTEITNAYNYAVLYAAEDAGIAQVQAIDAQYGRARSDPKCIGRRGKIYSIAEALAEQSDTHPNDTLQWRILKKPVQVERLPVPQNVPFVSFDQGDKIVVGFVDGLSDEQQRSHLIFVVDKLQNDEIDKAS